MSRSSTIVLLIVKESREQARLFGIAADMPGVGVKRELCLGCIPGFSADDGLVLAVISGALMINLAKINRVGEQTIDLPTTEWPSTVSTSGPCFPGGSHN